MFSCIKTYRVEYAHQLWSSYTSLCHETIHGHSGKIEIQFIKNNGGIDKDSMVVDFGKISAIIKDHIMTKYDHALFMPKMFPKKYLQCLASYNKRFTVTDENPTAENFAKWIYQECATILKNNGMDVRVESVVFHETETGCAMYTAQDENNKLTNDWSEKTVPNSSRTFFNIKKKFKYRSKFNK